MKEKSNLLHRWFDLAVDLAPYNGGQLGHFIRRNEYLAVCYCPTDSYDCFRHRLLVILSVKLEEKERTCCLISAEKE